MSESEPDDASGPNTSAPPSPMRSIPEENLDIWKERNPQTLQEQQQQHKQQHKTHEQQQQLQQQKRQKRSCNNSSNNSMCQSLILISLHLVT